MNVFYKEECYVFSARFVNKFEPVNFLIFGEVTFDHSNFIIPRLEKSSSLMLEYLTSSFSQSSFDSSFLQYIYFVNACNCFKIHYSLKFIIKRQNADNFYIFDPLYT